MSRTLKTTPSIKTDAENDASLQRIVTGQDALLTAALAQSDLADLKALLTAPSSQIVVLEVPSPQWATAIAGHLHREAPNVRARAVVELKKAGNASLFAEFTDRLALGMHLVIVAHDPQMLLPQSLLAAADASFALRSPRVKLLRLAIEKITEEPVKTLRSRDFEGLDFDALAAALRAGSTPGLCIRRLRRASVLSRKPQGVAAGPSLADLPLSPEIASWSTQLLADLRRVDAGELVAGDLPFPVLEGPPGTGKTLIATALAHSAGWRVMSTSVGSWFSGSDGYLGGVSKAIAQFFDELLKEDQVVGFIDEIDAIPNRAHLDKKDREWWTPVVTQLLLQIDRVRRSGKPVILCAATNYYDRLDAALIRGMRFDQRVSVLPPQNVEEVEAVLVHYLKDALEPAVVQTAAQWCLGRTPADIEAVVRAARNNAASASRPMVAADLLDAIAPPEMRSAAELRATAIHEAGHAVVSLSLGLPVETVSIIADGARGGFTRGEAGTHFPNRSEIEAVAMVMLGGRAADIVLGKGAHAGAEQDLAMATDLLRRAIAEFGLYESLAYRTSLVGLRHAEAQVETLLQALLQKGMVIVREEQRAVQAFADALLAQRVLNRSDVDRIFHAHRHKGGTIKLTGTREEAEGGLAS